jgi:UDP-glucuronate decarboxylase
MKILVTGGAGFIGHHLIKRLLEQGHKVICVDNLVTGSRENLKGFDIEFIEQDICEPLTLECDQIYNLACPASPVQFKKNPLLISKTCTLGSLNLLELAKKNKAQILQASTSEVYGDPKEHPQKETYNGNVNPTGPRACYDVGKRLAESMFMDYNRHHNVEVRIVRIFNTYGPGLAKDDGRVVSNFMEQALKGENLTVYGDGTQTRSFQYIDDLIDGLILMMNQNDFTGPVNMGNPNEITIKELAEKIIELTASKSAITYKDLPQDDPVRRQPDITLAKQKLGWEPKVGLAEGLKKTIQEWSKSD